MTIRSTDARKLKSETLERLRDTAVRLHLKGHTRLEIADLLDVHRNTVGRWLSDYGKLGAEGLKAKKRGVAPGTNLVLCEAEQERIKKLLVDKTPEQYKFPFALWTREAVQELIYRMNGVKMPLRSVSNYLKRWGFSAQKPAKQAYERCPKAVQHWLDTEYPAIEARAKAEDAEIHWGDETGVRNHCQHERGFAPVGKTPVVQRSAKRFSVNVISSLTNQGKVRFMAYDTNFDAKVFLRFLKRLVKDAKGRKLFLILDNLRVHHAVLVRDWVEQRKDLIELFFLPAYAPDLNPDEYLNGDIKRELSKRPAPKTRDTLKRNVISVLHKIQKSQARVKAYFKHRCIAYAA